MANVARVPELVEMIALYCPPKARKNLLLSCRTFFAVVAPLVWRKVKGAETLLRLVEGTTVINLCPGTVPRTLHIRLPETLSGVVLQRIQIYAPFVRHFDIFNVNVSDYKIPNLQRLLDLSLSSPLLPNLLSLTATNPTWPLDARDSQLPLLLIFISPSLLEYRTPYDPRRQAPMIAQSRFAAILSVLQRRCPDLRTLELYCGGDLYNDEGELPLVPEGYEVSEYFNFANLCSLSTNLSVLKDLGDLRSISQVKRLKISSFSNIQSSSELPSFQDVEWPNLQHLTLSLSSGIETFFCLWQVSPLVAGLTSVKLQIGGFKSRHIEDTVERVATLLAEQSPKLTNVSFYRSPPLWPSDWLDSAPLLSMLSKLAVRGLHTDIGDLGSGSPCLGGLFSGQTFSSIRSIDAGAYRVKLEDLRSFAQSMPNLAYLRIQIWISNEGGERATQNPKFQQKFGLRVRYITLAPLASEVVWEGASKYLLSLWPNVRLRLEHEVRGQYGEWMRVFKKVQAEQK